MLGSDDEYSVASLTKAIQNAYAGNGKEAVEQLLAGNGNETDGFVNKANTRLLQREQRNVPIRLLQDFLR